MISKEKRRAIRYTLLYWLVRSLIAISGNMPRAMWLSFCGGLGAVAYRVATKTRNLMVRHLAIAFPEKNASEIKRLAKETFRMLGKNAGEILRASAVRTLQDLERILVTHGFENFLQANARGKGVIFLTGHIGAFDLMVSNMALRGLNPNIIGTPLKDKRLNELLWGFRNAHGAIAIERGRETFRMIKVLKSGGSLALLIDQDTKVKSRFVNFFGKPASTPVGATVLAMKTGAAIVPAYIHLGDDGLQHMHLLPEIPMRDSGDEEADLVFNTQAMTTFLEEQIRKHPTQWVWMHERWKTQPGEEIA
jgi:Kdo2-lipid IVA lauroyltransferase/acyltransferase